MVQLAPPTYENPLPIPEPNGFHQGELRRAHRGQSRHSAYFFALLSTFSLLGVGPLVVVFGTVIHDTHSTIDPVLAGQQGLRIFGNGLQFDSVLQTLSILWRITAYENPSEEFQSFNASFNVYIDDPSTPVFSHNADGPTGEGIGVRDRWTFATNHQVIKRDDLNPGKQSWSIFERYSLSTVAFVIDPVTNNSIHMSMFSATGTFGDFVLRSHDVPSTNKFVFCFSDGPVATRIPSRFLEADLQLSVIAQVYSSFLFIAGWALTACSMYVTLLAAIGRLELDSPLISLPPGAGTVIFAIRSAASAPPFGASVGTVSTFVQLMAISFCCLVLLILLARV